VPAVGASGLFELRDVIAGDEHSTTPIGYVLVATLIAFVVGYAAIAWFLRYLAHHSVRVFVIYRILLGGTVLILVATGAIS
jgi:undecaprenyl-diphosphatase